MQVDYKDCVALIVYSITFLLGLPANLLVLFVYVRKARKHGATPNVVYALNLCLANLALVVWLPVKALETLLQNWMLPAPVCPIYSFFLFPRCMPAACSSPCVALVAEGGPNFVSIKGDTLECYGNFNDTQLAVLLPLRLEMAIVLFILPLIVTSFCTLRCVTLVWRSNLRPMGKRRVLTVALSTLAVFVVCYAPYNASHIVGFVQHANVQWRMYAMLTSSFNVFLEPVVMMMLSPASSRGFMGRMCGRQSQFSRNKGGRHRVNSANGVANARAPQTLLERSQAGAQVTKESHE
ncbi:Free fatty acid receptor 3 [Dissostichus eleginoides]|uniref:Free fatty acid receptor 3 n=1 Tax=Dissostichus eleginoides TaxID=100907 RepID=A0AAD9BFD1_DISEL|nr:Free fatty acid receptor 3 [Dissostichus eleginoides]